MRFVSMKSIEQQGIQALHRYRQRLVQDRTALVNQTRGLLTEYGFIVPQSIGCIRKKLPQILEDTENNLCGLIYEIFGKFYEELCEWDEKIKILDKRITCICKKNEDCQLLAKIAGVCSLAATALVSTIEDIHAFKNGRHLAAWLGLVLRQCSSGNKQVLLGISKRGERYLRTLLIHGVRACISRQTRESSMPKRKPMNIWVA